MLKLGLPTPWKTTICLGSLVKRVQGIHYNTGRLRCYSSKSGAGNQSHGGDAKKALEDNPEFQKLAEDYASHDHIHMRESETEKNDYFKLGSMLTRVPMHENLHTHSQPNPLLVLNKQEFRKNKGVRITWIGLLSNVGLAAGKFAGGVVFHSQALLADAVHALSDLVSDFLTLFAVTFASKKPTSQYPYGYGKIETVGSLAVSVILTMAGVSIGWASLCSIVGPFVPHAIMEMLTAHLHLHSHAHDITNINAAWIAGGSIFVKEWIFRATKKVAIETSSNVLMANAWHHRVDSLTSLVALITISSGCLLDIQCLDAVGGLMVSALVVNAGYKGMYTAVSELVDRSLPPTDERFGEIKTLSEKILRTMLSNNNSGRPYAVKHLSVLMSGPNAYANMILEAPLQRWDNVLTISEIELVTDHLRSVLYKDIPYLRKLDVEYVEERPKLNDEERKQFELQKEQLKERQSVSVKPQNDQLHSHSHSHSHSLFPFGKDSH